tara:strand:+ start:638 stop:895 length:258 start_codon:yes stop_codon:yes gene_type:complete
MSGKQHKMVNLCMASYAAAGRMDNFSGWVRTQLLKEASGGAEIAISEASSRKLLAVILARAQGDYGFDSEIVETIIALMNHEQLV